MSELSGSTGGGMTDRPKSLLPDAQARRRQRRLRTLSDHVSRYGISLAGLGVVGALALIFVYLFSEVLPVLRPANISPEQSYNLSAVTPEHFPEALQLERYEEIGVQATPDGRVIFFDADNGAEMKVVQLPIPEGTGITSFASGQKRQGMIAYGLDNGQAVVASIEYDLTYPEDVRVVVPKISYPLGEAPIDVDPQGEPLVHLALQQTGRGSVLAAATAKGRLLLNTIQTQRNIFSGEVTVRANRYDLPPYPGEISKLLVDDRQRALFIIDPTGYIAYYDIDSTDNIRMVERVRAVAESATITAAEFLAGTVSLIVGGSDGSLLQMFLVRQEDNTFRLARVRQFESHQAAISSIETEYTRKGFIAGDTSGAIGVHFATSSRTLFLREMLDAPVVQLAISPINTRMLALDGDGLVHALAVRNPHPQVSFKSLWHRVWYEGRSDPDFIWQSSSASDEFEPKMSLVPLTVGTLKAAFFAMLMAMPIAVMGAIYTAYFMTPRMRGLVKPTIEIMEALPTVILGFLAGLWLAPFVESNLPVVFTLLVGLPASMLLTGLAWHKLPQHYRNRIPPGWEAALLVPVILLVGWLAVASSPWIEIAFFDGSMRQWFTDNGITYDQRNALVVGIAMGFAVIPTIFSIAEDAVFNVPRHLTQGSLALGATAWQTVVGVVLPTASPGIFSAVMIGFGRAVGETMIVLMATGNSPVVNFNIFEGMRTLSANIAVELPETAVGSTHFRVLFLAALVLLVMTFVVNTIAEIVRQRLRARYSSL